MHKKYPSVLRAIILLAAVSFASCDNPITQQTIYTITFDSQGAQTAALPATMSVTLPTATLEALPAEPQKTGYSFTGWWTGTNGSGTQLTSSTIIGSSFTVYAAWTVTPYTITYYLDGGELDAAAPTSYTIESETIVPLSPEKDTYRFEGWYRESTYNTQLQEIPAGSTGNIELYAKWSYIEPSLSVTASIDIENDEVPITFSKVLDTVAGESITITADEGFASYAWFLNGMLLDESGSSVTMYLFYEPYIEEPTEPSPPYIVLDYSGNYELTLVISDAENRAYSGTYSFSISH